MSGVELGLAAAGAYLAAGLLFGLAFVSFGVGRVDPAARGAPLQFRLIILPAVAALWPFMLVKWITGPGAD